MFPDTITASGSVFGGQVKYLNHIDEDDVTSHVVIDNLEYLLNTPWPGKDGPSRKAVYLAHLLIAYRSHKTQYSASVRELAEMAGVSISTASKANTKLVSDGFLKIISMSSGDFPVVYELENKHTYLHSNQYVRLLNLNIYDYLYECSIILAHDSFRRGALGKSCWDIWTILSERLCTESELVEITGRDPSTVKKCLKMMSEITCEQYGWSINLVKEEYFDDSQDEMVWNTKDYLSSCELFEDLDRIAILYKSYGKGEKQKQKHLEQRSQFSSRFVQKGG